MNIEIYKAVKDDLQAILELYNQKDMDRDNVLSVQEAQEIFDKFSTYPDYSLFVAKREGQVVGSFELLIMDNLAHKGTPSAIIEDVVVNANFQSQGIGTLMMEYAMKFAKQRGCYKLVLSSSLHRERAHKFYENLGFKKHGYSFLVEFS